MRDPGNKVVEDAVKKKIVFGRSKNLCVLATKE